MGNNTESILPYIKRLATLNENLCSSYSKATNRSSGNRTLNWFKENAKLHKKFGLTLLSVGVDQDREGYSRIPKNLN